MKNDEIKKLIKKARERQDAAYMNYQETGDNHYYNTFSKNEALADTLEDALRAEAYIRTAKRLSCSVRHWAALFEDAKQKNISEKDEVVSRILSEIIVEARGLELSLK